VESIYRSPDDLMPFLFHATRQGVRQRGLARGIDTIDRDFCRVWNRNPCNPGGQFL